MRLHVTSLWARLSYQNPPKDEVKGLEAAKTKERNTQQISALTAELRPVIKL
jgi:hypothetical protein